MVNLTPEWVSAIAAVVYSVFTLIIIWSSYDTNKITKLQVDTYKKQLIEEHRPIVTLSLVADGSLALLRIKNEGNRIAEDVKVECNQDIHFTGKQDLRFAEQFKTMCSEAMTIASNEQWDLVVGVTWELEYIQPSNLSIHLDYSCDGECYHSDTTVRFNSFSWARSYRDDTHKDLENIHRDLDRCHNELKKIAFLLDKEDE